MGIILNASLAYKLPYDCIVRWMVGLITKIAIRSTTAQISMNSEQSSEYEYYEMS